MAPRTRYARSDGGAVAYQVLGDGPDVLYVPNWQSNLDVHWDEPSYAAFLQGLASFSRLVCFDKRGSGLSESLPVSSLPTLERWMDDILAVMDTVGSRRAALVGCDIGGPLTMLFAATYPERVTHLVLVDTFARLTRDETHPCGVPRPNVERFHRTLEEGWGDPHSPGLLSLLAPGASEDPRFRSWFSRMARAATTPTMAAALSRTCAEWDVRPVLGSIQCPTLVLHHQSTRNVRPAQGRFIAEHIEGARYLDLPGHRGRMAAVRPGWEVAPLLLLGMFPAMLVAMLLRPAEYAHADHERAQAAAAR